MENKYPLIGERIKFCRKQSNLTQEQLAEKVGLSQNFLSNIERGKGFPSLETIINLANALCVSADSLLFDYIEKHTMSDDEVIVASLSRMSAEKILCLIADTMK